MRSSHTSTSSQAFSHINSTQTKNVFPIVVVVDRMQTCANAQNRRRHFSHTQRTHERVHIRRVSYKLCCVFAAISSMERPEKPEESDGRAPRLQTRVDRWFHHCRAHTRSERARASSCRWPDEILNIQKETTTTKTHSCLLLLLSARRTKQPIQTE